ncbi:hypothetical protein SAMN02745687_00909 [Lachnospiraceae bacterium NK3A20]|nr:hypothetical protein SAMN02745687_00909 [Lachnospiraceae bacterium NK3A20]
MKKLDMYIVLAMLYITGWSIAFFIAWIRLGVEPSTLEGCILTPGVVELVCGAWIKSGRQKAERERSRDAPEPDDELEIYDIDDGGLDDE